MSSWTLFHDHLLPIPFYPKISSLPQRSKLDGISRLTRVLLHLASPDCFIGSPHLVAQPVGTGSKTDILHRLKKTCCHTSPGLNEGSKPLGKDCSSTGRHITEELAHMQDQANALPCTWHICKLTAVMAMDTGGACPTEGAARGSLR